MMRQSLFFLTWVKYVCYPTFMIFMEKNENNLKGIKTFSCFQRHHFFQQGDMQINTKIYFLENWHEHLLVQNKKLPKIINRVLNSKFLVPLLCNKQKIKYICEICGYDSKLPKSQKLISEKCHILHQMKHDFLT